MPHISRDDPPPKESQLLHKGEPEMEVEIEEKMESKIPGMNFFMHKLCIYHMMILNSFQL